MKLKRVKIVGGLALSMVLGSFVHASAQDLIALNTENTGESASGGDLAVGASDLNWTVSTVTGYSTGPTTVVTTTPASAVVAMTDPVWVANGSNYEWIAPTTNQSSDSPNGTPPGVYDYKITFTVPANLVGPLTVSGDLAVDNGAIITGGTTYTLGASTAPGTLTSIATLTNGDVASGNKNYATLMPFSFTYTAAPGSTSEVDIFVDNSADTVEPMNPSGIQVSDFSIVPEPSQYMTMAGLLLFLLVGGHRWLGRLRNKPEMLGAI